ncbi:DUF1566 domain-containing protein [Massilia sp. CMS3.1]|uniref:Lcl C-terminal domain-containing protein n=1 Tax=Massilia sp. CMS3.1 TaxID=3373083 RepID=UPI003EE68D03
MTTKRILAIAAACALSLLSACGSNEGVELGAFPAISKTEGDPPFALTAPSSKSPAAFSYASSDTRVASIVGDMVTVGIAGTTTITARQGELGSYNPTSTSAVLTVAKRVCVAPLVNENGQCVVPTTTAAYVSSTGVTWMPATIALTWAEADAYCKNTSIQKTTGWKLPTQFELAALVSSGALSGQGWAAGHAWTATAGSTADSHFAVNLGSGASDAFPKENKAFLTCVR